MQSADAGRAARCKSQPTFAGRPPFVFILFCPLGYEL